MNAATVSGPRSRMTSAIGSRHRSRSPSIAIPSSPSRTPGRRRARGGSARCGPTRPPAARGAASAALDTGLRLTDRMTSPGRKPAGRRAVRIDVGDERAGLARRQLQPPRDLRRQVAERQAEAAALLRFRRLVAAVVARRRWLCCSASRSSSSTVTFSVFSCLFAQHLHRHRRARLGGDDHLRRARRGSAPAGR